MLGTCKKEPKALISMKETHACSTKRIGVCSVDAFVHMCRQALAFVHMRTRSLIVRKYAPTLGSLPMLSMAIYTIEDQYKHEKTSKETPVAIQNPDQHLFAGSDSAACCGWWIFHGLLS